MIVLASRDDELLRRYRESLGELHVVVEVRSLRELTEVLSSEDPDIVFVDSSILNSKPRAALKTLSVQHANVPFVVWGCPCESAFCLLFLTAGARGLLPRDSPAELAPRVVEAIKRGDLWVSRRGLTIFLDTMQLLQFADLGESPASQLLSKRELMVGRLAASGLSNKEIARRLEISERTVKAHISSLFEKLNIRDRTGLIRFEQQMFEQVKQVDSGQRPDSAKENCGVDYIELGG